LARIEIKIAAESAELVFSTARDLAKYFVTLVPDLRATVTQLGQPTLLL
jgi:hypothetical protein